MINRCETCGGSWYQDQPEKHMMTCTAAAASALDRLEEAATHPGSYVSGPDLVLVLEVVGAAENAVGNVEDHQERRDLRQALEALTKETVEKEEIAVTKWTAEDVDGKYHAPPTAPLPPDIAEIERRHEACRVAILSQRPPINATIVLGLAVEAHADRAALLAHIKSSLQHVEARAEAAEAKVAQLTLRLNAYVTW